jgi:hypothetical protein
MAVDLAIDYNSGDLIVAPNKDLDRRTGSDLTEQRIRVRLRIIQGEWLLDPTGGTLGSRLVDSLRQPIFRAVDEIPLLVREAIEPMDDIDLVNVTCDPDPTDSRSVTVVIYYQVLDQTGLTTEEQLTTSVTLAG